MPSQVFQESISLEVDILEGVMLDPSTPEYRKAYPFPGLVKAGRKERIELPIVVLENDFLSASIAPTLGGRILNISDKQSGVWLFEPYSSLTMKEGGPRGVQCDAGIRWSPLGERLNDLGPVDFQMMEPDSDDDPAGVWLAELVCGSPLSVHLGISLPPDEAALHIEMRSFNRSFRFVEFSPHVSAPMPGEAATAFSDFGAAFLDRSRGTGLYVQVGKCTPRDVAFEEHFAIAKFRKGILAPRQLDTWSVRVLTLPRMESLEGLGDGLAVSVSATDIAIAALKEYEEAKVVLNTSSEDVVDASVSLQAGMTTGLALGDYGLPRAMVIVDGKGNRVLGWPAGPDDTSFPEVKWHDDTAALFERLANAASLGFGYEWERKMESFSANLGYRAASLSVLGAWELRKESFLSAASLFEEALSFNADDHLTWWMLAAAKRHAGDEGERTEILNAHYLAPLEPLLRAESFLQDPSHESPSLLDPLKDDPDALIEVACSLFDLGLFGDLSRWVRAGLALREEPMLRYILAAALLAGSSMKAEAAHELALAAKAPLLPPYPWRETEGRVLEILAASFPKEKRVLELMALFESALSSESHAEDSPRGPKKAASVHPLSGSPSKGRRVRK